MTIADNNACQWWHHCREGHERECSRLTHTGLHFCRHCTPADWFAPKTDDVRTAS
jgi:hypothetical protein